MKTMKYLCIALTLFACKKETANPVHEVENVVISATGGYPNFVNARFNGKPTLLMKHKGVKGDVVEVYEVGGQGHYFDAWAYLDGKVVKESHGAGLYIKIEL